MHLNVIGFIVILSTLGASAAFADCKQDDDACWKQEWKKLCAYDVGQGGTEWCKKLVNGDGTWKKPKWEVQENLKNLGPLIRQTGAKYGVDPRAIAGAVFAENSINVTKVDDFEDFLVKWKIAKNGKIPIINKSFSFGWGQLYIEAARQAEPIVAKSQGRTKLRSDAEIAQALEVPEQAMEYIAGVMQQIQEVYAKDGIDISKKPELLATVYNLGHPAELARKTKQNGGQPRVNFFGFFIEHYMSTLEKDIGYHATNAALAPAPPKALAPGPAPAAKAPNMIQRLAVSKTLTLYRYPPRCDDDSSSLRSEYYKIATYDKSLAVGSVKSHAAYEVISPGLGCQMSGDKEPWSLVRSDDGTIGWTSDASLERVSTKVLRDKADCQSGDKTCPAKVKLLAKGHVNGEEAGEVSLRLSTKKADAKNVSWKKPNIDCEGKAGMGGGMIRGSSLPGTAYRVTMSNGNSAFPTAALNGAEIGAIKERVQELKDKIRTTLKLTDATYNTAANPYLSIFNSSPFVNMMQTLDSCLPSGGQPPTNLCVFDKDTFKDLLALPLVAEPGYKQWKAFADAAVPVYGTAPVTSAMNAGDIKADIEKRKKTLRKLLGSCSTLEPALKECRDYLDRINTAIDSLNPYSLLYSGPDTQVEKLAKDCQFITDLDKPHTDCLNCATEQIFFNSAWVDPSVVKPLLKTAADKDAYLIEQLKMDLPDNLLAQTGGGAITMVDFCTGYDPFATAAEITKLLKSDCVKTVYVPDPWLLKKFDGQPKRVVYRPFIDDSQYAVDTGLRSCGEAGGAQ